ncbi:hypothetical protein GCM10009727_32070 [Actinomadura napierensis]|uniref:Uncharacterized protein n=1 Tax=Actinomadura napierensis TaxID=267854 RepID=A0ABP5KWH0_9ACTN
MRPVDGAEAGEGAAGGTAAGVHERNGVGALAQGPVEEGGDGRDLVGDAGEDEGQFAKRGASAGGSGVQRYLLRTRGAPDDVIAMFPCGWPTEGRSAGAEGAIGGLGSGRGGWSTSGAAGRGWWPHGR